MAKLIERGCPWVIPLIPLWLLSLTGTNYLTDPGIHNVAQTSIEASAIIVGLMSAFLPALLALRDGSDRIRSVLKKGGNLLKEYIFSSIVAGFAFMVISFVVMFSDSYKETFLFAHIFSAWFYFALAFVCTAIRAFWLMTKTMFIDD